MKAFYVVHATVTDPEKLARYQAAVPPTLAPCGGQLTLPGR